MCLFVLFIFYFLLLFLLRFFCIKLSFPFIENYIYRTRFVIAFIHILFICFQMCLRKRNIIFSLSLPLYFDLYILGERKRTVKIKHKIYICEHRDVWAKLKVWEIFILKYNNCMLNARIHVQYKMKRQTVKENIYGGSFPFSIPYFSSFYRIT